MASVMMAVATWMVASTSTGPITLGSTWRAHDAQRRHAGDARGLHVFLVALHQRGAAHRARVLHPAGQRDRRGSARRRPRVSCAFGKHRAAHAGDQQRHQDRREATASRRTRASGRRRSSRRGSPPAGRGRRRSPSTAAPTPRPPPARCARRTSAPTGCRGPGRRCPAGTWRCPRPARPAAGARRVSSSVVRSNGLCGATQPANTAQNTQTSAISAAPIAIGEVRKL